MSSIPRRGAGSSRNCRRTRQESACAHVHFCIRSLCQHRVKLFSMNFTRRDLAKLGVSAMTAAALRAANPNSVWVGVQVGINVPYSFHNLPQTADEILAYMTRLDLSAAELRLQPVEAYLNAPKPWAAPRGAGRGQPRAPLT